MATSSFTVKHHVIDGQRIREYARDTTFPGMDPKIQIKQYIPKANGQSRPGEVTIIAASGMGFIKEVYEPLFEEIVRVSVAKGCQIKSIWIADMSCIGSSAVTNKETLGNDHSWWDHSRDLLLMVNRFRSEMTQPLVGLGHSMGGAQLAHLSILHPSLFTSLVLIEPQIHDGVDRGNSTLMLKAILLRKESWTTRAAAEKALSKSPFYTSWDARAIDRLLEHSLITLEDEIRTTTPRHMEISLAIRPNFGRAGLGGKLEDLSHQERMDVPDLDPEAKDIYPFYRPEPTAMFKALPNLRPAVLFVAGDSSPSFTEDMRQQWMQRTGVGVGGSGGVKAGQVEMHMIEGGTHMMTMDSKIAPVAEIIGEWLAGQQKKWTAVEGDFRRDWDRLSIQEKQQVHPLTSYIALNYKGKETLEDFVERQSKL